MMQVFEELYDEFMETLREENVAIYDSINQQMEFRLQLYQLAESIKRNKKEKVAQKNINLRKAVSKGGEFDMAQFDKPRPMSIDPRIYVRGIDPSKCFVFKSAMCPLKLTFYAQYGDDSSNKSKKKDEFMYDVMYKHGDDVRQDQLVLQMISLMDNLLKQINLDFQFTAYKILAMSKNDGMLEFVPGSTTI